MSIFTENFPVVLSWDEGQFESIENPCHKASVLVEDFRYFNFPMMSFSPFGLNGSKQLTLNNTFGLDRYNASLTNGSQGQVRVYYFGFLERPLSGTVNVDPLKKEDINLIYHEGELSLMMAHGELLIQSIEIVNVEGKKWTSTWEIEGKRGRMDVGTLPAGLYTCLIQSNKGQQAI